MVQLGEGVRVHRPGRRFADVFAHFSEISGDGYRNLTENQRVEYEVTQGPKGLQASNIRPA